MFVRQFSAHVQRSRPPLKARGSSLRPTQHSASTVSNSLEAQESQSITLPDRRMLGFSTYGPENGQPIFVGHGLPGSRIDARGFSHLDASRSIRFIGIDRPGMGLSSPQEGRKVADWPADVKQLADHLGLGTFKMLGTSGGGPYALACAHALPRRRLRATGLLFGVGPPEAGREGMSWRQYIGWAIAPHARWLVRTLAQRYFGNAARNPDPKVMEGMIKKFLMNDLNDEERGCMEKPRVLKEFVESMKETFREGADGYAHDAVVIGNQWGFHLEEIDAENILMWYGAEDAHTPLGMAQYMQSRLKGSLLRSYTGETHWTLADEERQGKAIIRQLAEAE